MRALTVFLVVLPSVALAQDEDDPAFSRRVAPVEEELGEPFPAPLPPEEEDPGFVPAAAEDDGHEAAPAPAAKGGADPLVTRRRFRAEPTGLRFRVAYRTWELGESAAGGVDSRTATKDDRFHAIALDAYPISGLVRFGLVTQVAIETSENDWFGTVGLALGLQRPGASWTPFGEVSVHTGVGQRTFCGNVTELARCQDHLTLLWGGGVEAGVDGRIFGAAQGTIAVGLEKNQFFSVEVENNEGQLAVFDDLTLTVKVGLGY